LLGLASWFVPFAISFLLFSVRRANAALFETLRTLVVLSTAGGMFQLYFRGRKVAWAYYSQIGLAARLASQ
jgi:hypothetical protein